MSDTPSYDEFLADPAGQWLRCGGAIDDDWAIQAARSSRQFRETLKDQLEETLSREGTLDERISAILSTCFDAQDIAEMFRRLTKVRPPTDWASDFGRRFARSVPPRSD